MCCQQVEDLFTEVREYVDTSGLVWNQEDWLRKLIKSHSRGIGLSHQTCRPFNRLQRFIWLALGRGLTVREDYDPFAPVFISATVTEASSIGIAQGVNEAQDVGSPRSRRAPPQETDRSRRASDRSRRAAPQETPPWQTPPGSRPEPEEAGEPKILKQVESRRLVVNLQHGMLAEELQHGMLAVKIGRKVEGVQVGVIVERDLHQKRSQRLVASDVKPKGRLRKEERDRRLYRKVEMISTDLGHEDRVVANQGCVMAGQASPMMS